eukprot:TRINITY_DN1678_c0_g1_i1.p1 TRINITY_DN1678_c0_g1~~TRINITY_DN1678_c0_g1_i1.p1  ORF type:complete len:278 (-),score=104.63 TRINITY_DN1678_c0_g1_i1:48-881(-)
MDVDAAALAKLQLNLPSLQRIDPYVAQVLDSAAHVTLYNYQLQSQNWEKKEVEGSLFVVRRSCEPFHAFIVLNRLSTNNMIEEISHEIEIQISEPYLLYRNKSGEINGIWFYNHNERERMCKMIQRITKQLKEQHHNPQFRPSQPPHSQSPHPNNSHNAPPSQSPHPSSHSINPSHVPPHQSMVHSVPIASNVHNVQNPHPQANIPPHHAVPPHQSIVSVVGSSLSESSGELWSKNQFKAGLLSMIQEDPYFLDLVYSEYYQMYHQKHNLPLNHRPQ